MSNTFHRTTARVAAWNLAGYGGIPEDRLERQVEALKILDAELVTLVEVSPFSAMERLRNGLAAAGAAYDSVMPAQQSDLNIGFLFKDGVSVENPRFVPGSDLGDPDFRRAVVADVAIGRFDFILIAVHLKSGRGRQEQELRDRQARIIGQYITDLRAESREDVLLMGDFNMIPGQDVSNFHHLGGEDLMDFLSSWDLQARYSHILPAGRANLLDGFAISRTYSTEYIRGSLQLFPLHWTLEMGRERFRERVSDHLPFVASFRIDRSRD